MEQKPPSERCCGLLSVGASVRSFSCFIVFFWHLFAFIAESICGAYFSSRVRRTHLDSPRRRTPRNKTSVWREESSRKPSSRRQSRTISPSPSTLFKRCLSGLVCRLDESSGPTGHQGELTVIRYHSLLPYSTKYQLNMAHGCRTVQASVTLGRKYLAGVKPRAPDTVLDVQVNANF